MRLAIDAGNTNIKFGLGTEDAFVATGRVPTKDGNTGHRLQMALRERNCPEEAEAFGICVVPSVRRDVEFAVPGIKWLETWDAQNIKILYEEREKLGADRLANAYAMYHMNMWPAICVDLGTATNIDVLDLSGNYIGGAILPGPETAVESLIRDTEMLENFDWTSPAKAIGRSTADCLRSGCIKGYKLGLEALINAMAFELGQAPKIVLTGGLARSPVAPTRVELIDQMLTLKGVLAWAARSVF